MRKIFTRRESDPPVEPPKVEVVAEAAPEAPAEAAPDDREGSLSPPVTTNLSPVAEPMSEPSSVTLAPPRSLAELGVSRDLLSGLVLRHLAAAGTLTGAAFEERLRVPHTVLQPVLDDLGRTQFLERGGHSTDPAIASRPMALRMSYTVTSAGRRRATELAAVTSHYLGPCPLGLDAAVALVRAQAARRPVIRPQGVAAALAELELDARVVEEVGTAMSSRASAFLYGPPGNGKSTIARCMAHLLGEPIEVPYAIAVGEDIIRFLDPVYHHPARGGREPADRRLALVNRPLVRAGGELQLDQLDLTYDRRARYYEASLQWKASGGVLVIDDFGRQTDSPARLLNRFIVPMEEEVDYLDLFASGHKIEVPFTCQIVFSTNLAPADLVDEAFLRRIAHKILVPDPTPDAYTAIFEREAGRNGLQADRSVISHLIGLYGDRPRRGSHPKQLIAYIQHRASYLGTTPELTDETVQTAFDAYLHPAFTGATRPVDQRW